MTAMRARGHDRLLGLFLAGSAAVHAGTLMLAGAARAPGGEAAAPPAAARLHVAVLPPPAARTAPTRPGHTGTPAASKRPAQGRLAPSRPAAGPLPRRVRSPAPRARQSRDGVRPSPQAVPVRGERAPARGAVQPEVVARADPAAAAPPARAPVPHAARAPAATAVAGAAAAARPRPATPGPRIEAALRLRLAEHFRYPPLARRRGWEGTVRLGLRIEPDGRLTRVRVLAGSGYAVLDRAAARALERVGRVPEAAGWLGGRPFDMVLPVEYRLVSR